MGALRFDVFGRRVDVTGAPGSWQTFYPGSEGKRRPADFIVPHDIREDGLLDYLADLFHEDASPRHPTVRRLDP